MTAAKNDVFIGLKFLFSGGIDFWCEGGGGGWGSFPGWGMSKCFGGGFCLPGFVYHLTSSSTLISVL